MIDPVILNWVEQDGPARAAVVPRGKLLFTTMKAQGYQNGRLVLFQVEEIDPLLLREYQEYFQRA